MLKQTLTLALIGTLASSFTVSADKFAWQKLYELTDEKKGIGARPAGSEQEKKASAWLKQEWQNMGYDVDQFDFDFKLKGKSLTSNNLSVTLKGHSDRTIIIGAHYDSTGEDHGSLGTIDNGSGVAAILSLAKRLKNKSLPYTVRLVAFGAEEFGLQGAKAYVLNKQESLDNVIAMINLDTIIGGDKLYIHSANEIPYKCEGFEAPKYNNNVAVRDGLISVSKSLFKQQAHALHPAYQGYPEGQTGGWSDHAPFACSGIPIAYLEATNFSINGYSGNDGYSQTEHPKAWSCFNAKDKTACDKKSEKKWGMIWHTEFDRLDKLNSMFQRRLYKQLGQNVDVLERFALRADNWL